MNQFVAIDFETANNQRSSICSVGVIVVENRRIVDSYYSLVHPNPNYFTQNCVCVHGITKEQTESAPYFPEVWNNIIPIIKDYPLVAHNAPFDQSCLKAAFLTYNMPYPDYKFHCTLKLSKQLLNNKLPNHHLPTVSAYFGFDLTQHHHALADAEACARIAVPLFKLYKQTI